MNAVISKTAEVTPKSILVRKSAIDGKLNSELAHANEISVNRSYIRDSAASIVKVEPRKSVKISETETTIAKKPIVPKSSLVTQSDT